MTATDKELYECMCCERTVELDQHGRCPLCGSEIVMPVALIEKAQ
jgi:DNA-directed RNA polymerase subunit RPC12/RpoP